MKIICYFVVPTQHYDYYNKSFYLMPDNGDFLPIDYVKNSVIVYSGLIEQRGNIPCVVVKTLLDYDSVIHIKTQTTEFMRLPVYEYIKDNFSEVADLIALEAANNLTMNTVKDLQIVNFYAGRNIQELYEFYPELVGKINDIEFA